MIGNIVSNFGGHTGYNILAYNMVSGIRKALAVEGRNIENEVNVLADQQSVSKDPILSSNIQKANIFKIADTSIALYPFSKMLDFCSKKRVGFPMYEGSQLSDSDIAFLETLDHVISPCDHLTNIYKNSIKVPVTQIEVGIDTKIFQNYRHHQKMRDPQNPYTESNPCVFLMVGKFEVRKSSAEVLLAFLKLFEDHPMRDKVVLKLKWITQGYSRSLNEVKQTTNSLFKMYPRAAKRVVFLDNPNEDIVKLYNEADCFLFPSKAEGVGLPLLEAMACELPCITAPYTSLSTYANEHVTIMLPNRGQVLMQDPFYGIKPENWGTFGKIEIDDLMDAMNKFLGMSQEERLVLGLKARAHVQLNFDTLSFGKRILKILLEEINGSNNRAETNAARAVCGCANRNSSRSDNEDEFNCIKNCD